MKFSEMRLAVILLLTALSPGTANLLDSEPAHYHLDVPGNYEPHQTDQPTEAPGDGGREVIVDGPPPSITEYGMAMEISDLIALNRTIPDIRSPGCR